MTTYKFTFCKLLKFWPILIQTVFAINHVAVLELLPNESVQGKISIEESRHLTDELRRQAVMNLPKGDYTVMTRDNIIALIPADEKEAECLAESCAVTIGRAIGVEFITQGTIGKFGNKLTISVELYETMNAKLLSSIVFESKDIDGLLGAIRKEAKPLFQSIITSKPLSEPGFAGLPEQARTPNNNASPNAGYTYFKDYQDDKSSKSLNQVNQGSDNKSMRL
ncbi:MAG: hypothetical protein LBB36_05345, partial [Fibromonadaceae bacterium]|nr:hypothetical protein [Fibromonadaceae bacterium]